MQRRALILVMTLWTAVQCAGAAAVVASLQKQFNTLDSVFTGLPMLPEARMKDVAPMNMVFRRLFEQYPEIAAAVRANSKGIVVNAAQRGGGEGLLHSDVSDSAWYAVPKKTSAARYGPLIKENMHTFVLWARPLIVKNALGRTRFGGVVALKIDVTECFKLFAARVQGIFAILLDGKKYYYLSWDENVPFKETTVLLPGNIRFSVRLPKKTNDSLLQAGSFSTSAAAKHGKTSTVKVFLHDTGATFQTGASQAASGSPGGARSSSGGFLLLKLIGAIVVVGVFILAAAVIARRKKRKTPEPAMPKQEESRVEEASSPDVESLASEEEKKRILTEESDALREQLKQRIRQEELENVKREVRSDVKDSLKEEYRLCMEHIERLSAFLAETRALQSLSQTVALLSEAKKKQNYFTLNNAQTESLIDYLNRVQNRLNSYFAKVGESVRELKLKVGSIINKLDNEE